MRILLIHNEYQVPGGEDRVVRQETALLSTHGHEILRLTGDNRSIVGPLDRLRTAWTAPYAVGPREACLEIIRKHRPDLAHIHNLFPLLTPSVLDACALERVPVVMTLHNYRLVCAGALLTRSGRLCTDCVTSSPYQAVWHRCYRGSAFASLASARVMAVHRKRGTWSSRVERFIALTEFGRRLFVDAGLPADRVCVKPNFCAPVDSPASGTRSGALFVGRLSAEKGVRTLLRAWSDVPEELRVAGAGSLGGWGTVGPNVAALGQLSPAQVQRLMQDASFLVMPSEWFEGFPLTIVEAFSCSLPVLASSLGAMAEIVTDGRTGLHFQPGDALDLAEKARWLFDHPGECRRMGANAREDFQQRYTPERNYELLMDIYRQAIDQARQGHDRP